MSSNMWTDFPDDVASAARRACLMPEEWAHYGAAVRLIATAIMDGRFRCAEAANNLISNSEEARTVRRAIYYAEASKE